MRITAPAGMRSSNTLRPKARARRQMSTIKLSPPCGPSTQSILDLAFMRDMDGRGAGGGGPPVVKSSALQAANAVQTAGTASVRTAIVLAPILLAGAAPAQSGRPLDYSVRADRVRSRRVIKQARSAVARSDVRSPLAVRRRSGQRAG